jgi:hypothetical protein
MSSVGTTITVRLTNDEVRWLREHYPPSQTALQCDDQGRNILAAVARGLPEPRYRLELDWREPGESLPGPRTMSEGAIVSIELDISLRYGVIGIYKDRDLALWRVYPVPFIRFSIARKSDHVD